VNAISSQTSNRVGPKPKSSCCHNGAPASGGLALTVTPVLCSCWNKASLANDGRCVVNRVTCSGAAAPGGVYVTGCLKSPSIVSPVEVIDPTLVPVTWVRKNV
jgi:hypothetical protein